MYVDLGTGVRRSKDVPRITYVLKSALVPDLFILWSGLFANGSVCKLPAAFSV